MHVMQESKKKRKRIASGTGPEPSELREKGPLPHWAAAFFRFNTQARESGKHDGSWPFLPQRQHRAPGTSGPHLSTSNLLLSHGGPGATWVSLVDKNALRGQACTHTPISGSLPNNTFLGPWGGPLLGSVTE